MKNSSMRINTGIISLMLATFLFLTILQTGCLSEDILKWTADKSTATPVIKSNTKIPTPASTLTVSAAASLTETLTKLTSIFHDQYPDLTVSLNFGSSGALQQQIKNGAPVDVFISASPAQMNDLVKNQLIKPGTVTDLLKNEVVLIVPAINPANLLAYPPAISSFSDLASPSITQIALGEPASVPAGQYGAEIIKRLGLTEALTGKLVYGKDVRQVLTYVENQLVQAGLVYRTDALSSSKVTIAATAPAGSHDPVIYPAGIVASSANPTAAQAFVAFLASPDTDRIFETAGFGRP